LSHVDHSSGSPISPHLLAGGAAVLLMVVGSCYVIASRWAPGLFRILPRQRWHWRVFGEARMRAYYHASGAVMFGCALVAATLAVLLWPR
jgi:hypothetical protein